MHTTAATTSKRRNASERLAVQVIEKVAGNCSQHLNFSTATLVGPDFMSIHRLPHKGVLRMLLPFFLALGLES